MVKIDEDPLESEEHELRVVLQLLAQVKEETEDEEVVGEEGDGDILLEGEMMGVVRVNFEG